MQEEVENRTVNLAISTTKLTGRTIIAGIVLISRINHADFSCFVRLIKQNMQNMLYALQQIQKYSFC